MISIIGDYQCKADAKGRIMLPSGLKKQLVDVVDNGFVLKKAIFNPCLELYPVEEYKRILAKVKKNINPFNREHNNFIRRFTAGVKLVDIDSAGRILIAKDLIEFAEIKKQVVMTAPIDIIEIWDKELYDKTLEDGAENFPDLAEKVMGNYNADELS
jgi:MraZ protein